jgi:hypothetical protein
VLAVDLLGWWVVAARFSRDWLVTGGRQ